MAEYIWPPTASIGSVSASQGTPNSIANAWPVKPTDGTNSQSFTASGEAKVALTAALPAGSNVIGAVTQSDGPWSISAASLPLPTDAATETTLSALNTKVTTTANGIKVDGSAVTQPVSAASLPLPSGAATETTLAALSAKFSALGQTTMATSVPVVIASNQTLLNVVDFFDTPLLDTSSSNIPGSASNPLQVVSTLASAVRKIQILDTTGGWYGVYTGAALSEVLVAVVGPGSDSIIEIAIAASTRISLRSLTATAISSGEVSANFFG